MRKDLLVISFAVLIIIQFAVPVSMIVKREAILKNGIAFRFRTQPVDPYDAFRGRYVALGVEVNKISKPEGMKLNQGQEVFGSLYVDSNGFAQVARVMVDKPREGVYLKVKAYQISESEVRLVFPIDRYYMEEKAAPRAEQLYRQHSGRNARDASVVVRVKDGSAVIEGLYIGNERIESMLKRL